MAALKGKPTLREASGDCVKITAKKVRRNLKKLCALEKTDFEVISKPKIGAEKVRERMWKRQHDSIDATSCRLRTVWQIERDTLAE